jgi:hypothetical protein
VDQFLNCGFIIRPWVPELGVPEFNRMNMTGAILGIENEDAATWISFSLCSQKGRRKFPLASTTQRIGFGVIG